MGIWVGYGILFGIGMLAHPGINNSSVMTIMARKIGRLGLFRNFEVSPAYLDYKALYKGFR